MTHIVTEGFLTELAQASGAILRENFYSHKNVSSKGKKGFVTDTDMAINEFLLDRFAAAGFDQKEVISEEKDNSDNKTNGRMWIIDPLDGTREFVYQIPEVCVSIFYGDETGQRAASLVNPMQDFLLVAADADSGEMKNQSGKVQSQFKKAIVASRSEQKKGYMANLEQETEIAWVGSIAYKLGLVAAGFARATVSYCPKNVWDIAAGFYLVEKSGGVVTDMKGNQFDFFARPFEKILGGIVASRAGENHGEILEQAQRCLVDEKTLYD